MQKLVEGGTEFESIAREHTEGHSLVRAAANGLGLRLNNRTYAKGCKRQHAAIVKELLAFIVEGASTGAMAAIFRDRVQGTSQCRKTA